MVPTRATPCAPLRPHVENPIGAGSELGNKLGNFCARKAALIHFFLNSFAPTVGIRSYAQEKEVHQILAKSVNTRGVS